MIRLLVAGLLALAVSTTFAAAAPPPPKAQTGASAVLLRISGPGVEEVSLAALEWPTSTTADVQSFRYPDDGSIASLGRSSAKVFGARGAAATTQAQANAIVLSLFDGEIVAAQVTASVASSASARSVKADVSASRIQGLRVDGREVASEPGSIVALGDWGALTVLSQSSGVRKASPPGAQASTVGLRVRLSEDHGGLPAGSEIVVASAEAIAVADVSAPPSKPKAKGPLPGDRGSPGRPSPLPPAPEPDVGGDVAGGFRAGPQRHRCFGPERRGPLCHVHPRPHR